MRATGKDSDKIMCMFDSFTESLKKEKLNGPEEVELAARVLEFVSSTQNYSRKKRDMRDSLKLRNWFLFLR